LQISSKAKVVLEQLKIPSELVVARNLHEHKEAELLDVAEIGPDGREHLLEPVAATAWRDLKKKALGVGVSLYIVSAFRSVERQTDIIRRKLAAGQSISDILAVSAPPCFSEHHTGRAVDVATPDCPALEVEFENTQAFSWLTENASYFGYMMSYPRFNANGYEYEPWHWCHVKAPNREFQLTALSGS
jgi:D-alanyl-D-alanine carboxypeptidase